MITSEQHAAGVVLSRARRRARRTASTATAWRDRTPHPARCHQRLTGRPSALPSSAAAASRARAGTRSAASADPSRHQARGRDADSTRRNAPCVSAGAPPSSAAARGNPLDSPIAPSRQRASAVSAERNEFGNSMPIDAWRRAIVLRRLEVTAMRSTPGTARNSSATDGRAATASVLAGKMPPHVANRRQRHHGVAKPVRREHDERSVIT